MLGLGLLTLLGFHNFPEHLCHLAQQPLLSFLSHCWDHLHFFIRYIFSFFEYCFKKNHFVFCQFEFLKYFLIYSQCSDFLANPYEFPLTLGNYIKYPWFSFLLLLKILLFSWFYSPSPFWNYRAGPEIPQDVSLPLPSPQMEICAPTFARRVILHHPVLSSSVCHHSFSLGSFMSN